jgi:hypothetical protein
LIPARPRRGLAGGRRGGDWELTYDPIVAEGGSGAAPVGSIGGVGRRRPMRPGCWRDGGAGGARRGVGRCCRSLGRGMRACTTSWRARGGVHLGGGGNHGGARQGQLGKDARDGRQCLNRPGSRGQASRACGRGVAAQSAADTNLFC